MEIVQYDNVNICSSGIILSIASNLALYGDTLLKAHGGIFMSYDIKTHSQVNV